MADIFDEVSEELRQDQILQIWKKYSKYIITFLAFSILCIFSYQGYNIWNKKKLTASSEEFFNALENLDNKKFEDSFKIFSKSSLEQNDGYKILSIFGLAESNFKKGNNAEMVLNYKSIFEDSNFDIYYQQLARILSVMRDNNSSFDQLRDRLIPILKSPSKLQILAAELEIVLYIRFKKMDEAIKSLKILLNRTDITLEQKSRLSLINKVYSAHAK